MYRLTYKLCSEAQSGIADALLKYSFDVESKVLSPLNAIVNVSQLITIAVIH